MVGRTERVREPNWKTCHSLNHHHTTLCITPWHCSSIPMHTTALLLEGKFLCTKAAIWIPGEKPKHKSPTSATLYPMCCKKSSYTTGLTENIARQRVHSAMQNAKVRDRKTLKRACTWQIFICGTCYTWEHWACTCKNTSGQELIIRTFSKMAHGSSQYNK